MYFAYQVYVVGGYDGQNRLSSVECYDSFSNRWTEVAPLKEAVSSPAVTSCVGKLFVIGGGPDDNTCSDKVSHVILQKLPMMYIRRKLHKAYQIESQVPYCEEPFKNWYFILLGENIEFQVAEVKS